MYDETPQKYFHAISLYEWNTPFVYLQIIRGPLKMPKMQISQDPPAGFFKTINSWTLSPQALILPVINASPAFLLSFDY